MTCPTISTTSSLGSAPSAPILSTTTTSPVPLEDDRRASCSPVSSDGWVVFSRARIPGVGLVVVEKRDGSTRSRQIGR